VISDGAPTGTVTTVLGDINALSLGQTNYNEHVFQVTPLLPATSPGSQPRPAISDCLPVSEPRGSRDTAQPASFR